FPRRPTTHAPHSPSTQPDYVGPTDLTGSSSIENSESLSERRFADAPHPPSEQPGVRFEAELEELEDYPRRRGRDAIRPRGGERRQGRPRQRPRTRPIENRESPPPTVPLEEEFPRPEGSGWGHGRPQNRAGEPGYVPRRARGQAPGRPVPPHEGENK